MFFKSAEVYFKEFHLAAETEKFVVFQFIKRVGFCFLYYFAIFNKIFYPPTGSFNISPNTLSYSSGVNGMNPAPV